MLGDSEMAQWTEVSSQPEFKTLAPRGGKHELAFTCAHTETNKHNRKRHVRKERKYFPIRNLNDTNARSQVLEGYR